MSDQFCEQGITQYFAGYVWSPAHSVVRSCFTIVKPSVGIHCKNIVIVALDVDKIIIPFITKSKSLIQCE